MTRRASRAPELSVVIPTRNRAQLLRHALHTCLRMDGEDHEVVVVDNDSTDDTAAVIDSWRGHPRLRVVNTTPRLSQVQNWEAAVEAAAGGWIVLLGDDDALPKSFPQRIAAAARAFPDAAVISWQPAYYTHRSWRHAHERNRLDVRPSTGAATWCRSADELERLVQRRESPSMPKIGNNAAVRREVVGQVADAVGSAFLPPIPDYTFGTVMLALGEGYLFVDQPLSIVGKADSSAGFSVDQRNSHSERFLGGFHATSLTPHTPLTTPAIPNLVAEAILAARAAVQRSRDVDVPDLDWARYFLSIRFDLEDTARLVAVDAEIEEWLRAVRSQPPAVRARIALRRAMRVVARTPVVHAARTVPTRWQRRRLNPPETVHGASAGFDDIAGAAEFLECRILPGAMSPDAADHPLNGSPPER